MINFVMKIQIRAAKALIWMVIYAWKDSIYERLHLWSQTCCQIIWNSQSAAFGSYCEASGGKLASLAHPNYRSLRSPTPLSKRSGMQNVPDLQ